MKRIYKNIIMVVLIVALSTGAYFTITHINVNSTGPNTSMTMPSNNQGGNNDSQQPPDKPSDSNQGSNSQPNDSNNQESNSSNEQSSSSTNDNQESSSSNQQSNDNSNNTQQNNQPSMPQNSQSSNIVYYVLLGVEGLSIGVIGIYLIMSRFNKKGFKEIFINKDKILIFVLSTCLLTGCLSGTGIIASKYLNASNTQMQNQSTTSSVEASGSTTVEDTKTLSDSYSSSNSDESAILVQNGGNATISGNITKGGDSSNTENSEFYGINSGILVTKNSTATIKNATIKTSGTGSNAVFSTGEDSKIYISDSTITTTGKASSRGLDATYGGYIEANKVTITTSGQSCASLATDRGEGTVKATNSTLTTNGTGSPVIYSTGDISVTKSTGTANGSQMVVVEGKNSATVTNSTLTCSGKGNRNDVDNCGIMLYQSMSGDASEGTSVFSATNSSLTINSNSSYYKSAPMFFVTNTSSKINLTNTKLTYGSNVLLSVKGTSEWGNSGSNGGDVEMNASKQTLKGNIEIDKLSTLTLKLTNSTYTGTINEDNSAKEVNITLDSNSSITLTGDSYVTSLTNNGGKINLNGHKLYVNNKLYSA